MAGPGKSFEKEIEKEKFHKLEINERQKNAVEHVIKKGTIKQNIKNMAHLQSQRNIEPN